MSYSYKVPDSIRQASANRAFHDISTLYHDKKIDEYGVIASLPSRFHQCMAHAMFIGVLANNKIKFEQINQFVVSVEVSGSRYNIATVCPASGSTFSVDGDSRGKIDFIVCVLIKQVNNDFGCKLEGYIDMLDTIFADVPNTTQSTITFEKSNLKEMGLLFNTLKLKI